MKPMPQHPQRVPRLAVVAAALAFAAASPGCALLFGSGGEPPRFYVLSPDPPADVASSSLDGVALGVGPISLPRYLDRDEIVTRVGANQLEMSRRSLWAEPIGGNFRDVLIQNLEARLPGLSATAFPWRRSRAPDYAVALDVARFEATSDGQAVLSARWRISDVASGDVLARRESFLTEPIPSAGTKGAVAALGRTLAELSDEIAQQLVSVARSAPRR